MQMEQKVALIKELVEKKREKFREVSDAVWEVPELFFHEDKSAAILIKALKEEGFAVEEGVDGIPTAFIGSWGSGKPIIGILGEFDALPSLSQEAALNVHKEIESGGPGHGCGHNALGAAAMAAAAAAKDYMEKNGMSGTIRYYGCPAEEAGWGKMFLARDGFFNDLDACLTWHPGNSNTVQGTSSLANMCAFFRFKGKTAHAAAAPHLGRSALDACEIMSVGVNYLREHVIPEARMHYAYQDVGGPAPNVVQDHACVKYFLRAPKITQVKEIGERVKDIARGAALITGTEVEIEFTAGMCDYVPNDILSGILSDALMAVGGPKFDDADRALAQSFFKDLNPNEIEAAVKRLSYNYPDWEKYRNIALVEEVVPYQKSDAYGFGSTDVGDASYCAPTAQMSAATYANGTPGHSWQVTAQSRSSITHKANVTVAEAISLACILCIEQPEKLVAAREEYVKVTGGKYICPVGMDAKPQF